MKLLIVMPHKSNLGGVTSHFNGLHGKWSFEIKYCYIGSRRNVPGPVYFLFDIINLIIKGIVWKPDVILLNPSLTHKCIKRERIILKLIQFLKIKKMVFFHGWDEDLSSEIDTDKNLIRGYQMVDGFLVLAKKFKTKLQSWGINAPIYLTSTKVDDLLLNRFDISKKKNIKKILFVSRIEKEKGIFTLIRCCELFFQMDSEISITVVGDGTKLTEAKKQVKDKKLTNIKFTGRLHGEELMTEFETANVFLFPTLHAEGMPTCVLEAMAFGLAIVTSPIGGVVDFFEQGDMGYLMKDQDPIKITQTIKELLHDEQNLRKIGNYNHKYACENFLASKVVKKLEQILSK